MFARRARLLLVTMGGLAVAAAAASPAAQASTTCPSTFRVLHNDSIGSLALPRGNYQVRVNRLSCGTATSLFGVFLSDYDGKLPGGWSVRRRGTGKGLFTRGSASFAVTYQGKKKPKRPVTNLTCSGFYSVRYPTQAGLLQLSPGNYRISRLSPLSPSCRQAFTELDGFLGQTGTVLPFGWVSLPVDGAFVNGSTTYGFRVEPR